MGSTPACKTFLAGERTITVEDRKSSDGQEKGYRVIVRQDSWHVTRTFGSRKAAAFVLRCLKRTTRRDLLVPITTTKIVTVLADGVYKLSGIEWISVRMAHGVRPIILKAPHLFRQRLIYIEPTERDQVFTLRLVDPLGDARSSPVEISQHIAVEAVKTFGHGT